jgi:hypothetical protein
MTTDVWVRGSHKRSGQKKKAQTTVPVFGNGQTQIRKEKKNQNRTQSQAQAIILCIVAFGVVPKCKNGFDRYEGAGEQDL